MIKKIICFYSLSVLLIFSSYSQKFEFGLKAGPNFATQKISTITNAKSITGYHLGGFMYFKLPVLFGIQVEGQYSKLGSEFQINQLINKNNLGYINIPVLIRNDFGPLNLHFGPQFGIMTNALDKFKNSIKSQFLDRDFSLIVGLGVRLPANFGLTVRYIKGLKNITDLNLSNTETKNTVIQVSLKYSIIQLGIKKNKNK